MDQTVKGIFLKSLVGVVKRKKGPEGVKKLEEKFGDINFASFKDYPLETQVKLNKAASEVIFDAYSPEAEYEFGKLSFKTYTDSVIGKTMFSLIGNDPLKIAFALPKILGTVTSGMDVSVEKLGPLKVKILMKNSPFHIRHYEGCCAAAAEHFNYTPVIEANPIPEGGHEYIVEWKEED